MAKRTQITDLADICSRISEIKTGIQSRRIKPALIVCLGYELLASDFEILGGDAESYEPPKVNKPQAKIDLPDMNEILERVKACSDPDEKRRIIISKKRSMMLSRKPKKTTKSLQCRRSTMQDQTWSG